MGTQNRTVIITGAGGGIGSAVAANFAREGANVVLVDLSMDALEKTAKALGLPESACLCLAADITKEEAVKAAVQDAFARFGHIDVLVNAAGINGPSAVTENYTAGDFQKVFAVNVNGTFFMIQNVLPIMQKQGRGVIVNIGSVSGLFGYPYEIAYGASKAAVIHMTKSVANENGSKGIRANCVSPGWVDTQMMREIVESYKDVGIENSSDNVTLGPLGRAACPGEIADAISFLASDKATYVNGSNFVVDGGMTLG